jgi:hypothetical protein
MRCSLGTTALLQEALQADSAHPESDSSLTVKPLKVVENLSTSENKKKRMGRAVKGDDADQVAPLGREKMPQNARGAGLSPAPLIRF